MKRENDYMKDVVVIPRTPRNKRMYEVNRHEMQYLNQKNHCMFDAMHFYKNKKKKTNSLQFRTHTKR